MKRLFIVDCGTYPNEILVAIGSNYNEIISFLKKKKLSLDGFEKHKEVIEKNCTYRGSAMMFKNGYLLLQIEKYREEWDWYEVLMHEVCHVVQYIFEHREIEDDEAFAYQLEYLFKTVRRRVQRKKLRKK